MRLLRLKYSGLNFITNYSNVTAFFSICYGGAWRPLLEELKSADIVLDAGANIGVFSMLASRRVSRVYAIEPDPLNFAFLQNNIRINKVKNVVAMRVALSDRKGISHMSGVGIGAHLAKVGTSVSTTTLDSLTTDNLSVIKMDIEGAEALALHGQRTLDDIRLIGVEADDPEAIAQELRNREFEFMGSYTDLISKSYVFSKISSFDFLRNEVNTSFVATRWALQFLALGKNPLSPLQGNEKLKILYALKSRNGRNRQC
jgi:FkbM family methyltransferase